MQKTISPVDGRVYVERALATSAQINETLRTARHAFADWRNTTLAERAAILTRFCDEFEKRGAKIAEELTWQMGRPARYAPNEVRGTLERARHMIAIAPQALDDVDVGAKDELHALRAARAARRGVHGRGLELPVPDRGEQRRAGADGRQRRGAQTLRADAARRRAIRRMPGRRGIAERRVPGRCTRRTTTPTASSAIRAWTSSRSRARSPAATPCSARRPRVSSASGLELGGCDPVYVRHDANLDHAIENIVDGAYFNSGQSCCGLQRVYVHDAAVQEVHRRLRRAHAQVRARRSDRAGDDARARWCARRPPTACARRSRRRSPRARSGAIDESAFAQSGAGTPYLAPQVLLDVNHAMPVMREEIFGPVAGIMKVSSDDEAVDLMNDSDFGLTAADLDGRCRRGAARSGSA